MLHFPCAWNFSFQRNIYVFLIQFSFGVLSFSSVDTISIFYVSFSFLIKRKFNYQLSCVCEAFQCLLVRLQLKILELLLFYLIIVLRTFIWWLSQYSI